MRRTAALLLALAAAGAAAADDGFSLGLVELPLEVVIATVEAKAVAGGDGLDVEIADDNRDALVFRAALTPTSEAEFRLAMWNSPMGRLYYGRAEAEAMLGREGLVHGGHSLGVGVATTAVGDASSSSLGFLVDGGSWTELTTAEKFAAAAEASFVAAILYGLVEMAD
ncbi:MAG TPA: hypothetical protein PLV66_06610 [Thermoanaerobaculales bacterium]|nr:hypothetical protein [Thermoanaerobaculales bacterium]